MLRRLATLTHISLIKTSSSPLIYTPALRPNLVNNGFACQFKPINTISLRRHYATPTEQLPIIFNITLANNIDNPDSSPADADSTSRAAKPKIYIPQTGAEFKKIWGKDYVPGRHMEEYTDENGVTYVDTREYDPEDGNVTFFQNWARDKRIWWQPPYTLDDNKTTVVDVRDLDPDTGKVLQDFDKSPVMMVSTSIPGGLRGYDWPVDYDDNQLSDSDDGELDSDEEARFKKFFKEWEESDAESDAESDSDDNEMSDSDDNERDSDDDEVEDSDDDERDSDDDEVEDSDDDERDSEDDEKHSDHDSMDNEEANTSEELGVQLTEEEMEDGEYEDIRAYDY